MSTSEWVVCHDDENLDSFLLSERENEITQISSDVYKVSEIFSDLGKLVSNQQHYVDDIENQIDNANKNTDGGVKQLSKAARYQRTRSKCLFYTFVTGMVVLIIIVIYIIIIT